MLDINSLLIHGEEIKYCAKWETEENKYALYITSNRIIYSRDTKWGYYTLTVSLKSIWGTDAGIKYDNYSENTLKILCSDGSYDLKFNRNDTKLMYEIQYEIAKAINF